jgi:hypothetical protein
VTEQGYPPRRPHHPGRSGPGRPASRSSQEPRGTGWQVIDAFDEGPDPDSDLPPWAVPGGIEPQRPGLRSRRPRDPDQLDGPGQAPRRDQQRPGRLRGLPGRSRAAAARRRRSKRRLTTWGGAAILVLVLVGAGLYATRSRPAPSRFVTTLQPGEFREVPDACKIYGSDDLRQLMNGAPKGIQPQNGQQQSSCTYTVDAKPTFRVLTILVQAMQAGLVPVGDSNGNATASAKYTFLQQRHQLAKPPKRAPQPPATITTIRGTGDQAFSALQTFRTKVATDVVTVLARYRNVLVTVRFEGHAGSGFGPVPPSELRSGALAVAQAVLSQVKGEPTV